MGKTRYSGQDVSELRNREVEATRALIWSQTVTAVFETDLDLIASVLPRPLEPSSATARLRFAVVDMGNGMKPFGAGWFGVRARHGDVEGEYALFMPMTTEQATIGGRETFGEPKKIGEVWAIDTKRMADYCTRLGLKFDPKEFGLLPKTGAT